MSAAALLAAAQTIGERLTAEGTAEEAAALLGPTRPAGTGVLEVDTPRLDGIARARIVTRHPPAVTHVDLRPTGAVSEDDLVAAFGWGTWLPTRSADRSLRFEFDVDATRPRVCAVIATVRDGTLHKLVVRADRRVEE